MRVIGDAGGCWGGVIWPARWTIRLVASGRMVHRAAGAAARRWPGLAALGAEGLAGLKGSRGLGLGLGLRVIGAGRGRNSRPGPGGPAAVIKPAPGRGQDQ